MKLVFDAPSTEAVNAFYRSAILGDASIVLSPTHGCDETPYYKAVVADRDNNHIGAMYRPEMRSRYASTSSPNERRIEDWQDDVASSTSAVPRIRPPHRSPQVIVNTFPAKPAVEVHRIKPSGKHENEISTRAFIGTILGASAGAAVAYALVKSESEKPHEPYQVPGQPSSYRAIEAPAPGLEVIYENASSDRSRSQPIRMIDNEVSTSRSSKTQPRAKSTTFSRSHRDAERSSSTGNASYTAQTIAQTNGTKIIARVPDHQSSASKRSQATKIKYVESSKLSASAQSSKSRSAKDVPLPPSRVSTNLTASNLTAISRKDIPLNALGTVVPDDSISQVSTRRSSHHHHHHRHHHHERSDSSKHGKKSGHGSHRTTTAA